MTEEPQAAGTSLVGKLICCCLLNPSPVMDTRNEEISSTSRDFENRACGERHHRSAGKRTPTTSLLDRSKVYGRKKDKEFILELLLEREVASNGRVCVVAIGGMEGVGKTTLMMSALMMNAFPRYPLKELSFDDSLSLFEKHALGSDLAQSIARETCVNSNDKQGNNNVFPDIEKTRHMSFTRRTYEVLQRFKDLGKLKRLRTFIALRLYSSPWAAYCYLSKNVLHEALFKLRRLRVLSLSGYCITELPNSIGDLKQLRYLNFSQTKIKRLPESVSTLINLQTLKLYGCRKLNKLPQGTGNLINLCHLNITGTDNLVEMPPWMGNLTDARHAVHDNLRGKHNLDELELEWFKSDIKDKDLQHQMLVLNSLQPHTNLKELKISFYGGTEFPSWVGHPSFSEIVHLKLSCCWRCTVLPPLGRLPLLRDLCIQGLDAVGTVGPEFYGDAEADGEAEEEFPSLSELTLWNCPKLLGKFPSCLPSCVKITIAKCPILVDSDEKLPAHSELKFEECDEVTPKCMFHNSSLITLKLGSMSRLTYLKGQFLRSLGLKVLMISDFPELTSLWQKGTELENFEHPQFVSLTEIGMPSTHKSSKLSGCGKLDLLPIQRVHMLLSLEVLCIESCPDLVSIPEAGLLSFILKGGVGKITAAQILPHVDIVSKSFELRLWVFVLDVLLTTTILLQAIPLETCKLSDDLNLLQLMLREKLSGKRCLIILDDGCKVDSTEQWDLLCRPLSAARGVKIHVGNPSFDASSLYVYFLAASTSMQWSPGLDEAIHQCLIVSTLRLSNTDHFAVSMEEYSTNEQGSSHGLATLAAEKQVGIPDLGALFVSSFCRAFGWLG
ncbi:hypothetical protein POTOM_005575 [Populus tomentosa]|uniref:NB-ARC domain-containing protein n=1 Tax=Populus tomentosa TaxID=118781 RepID=A0A8X8AM45_POPTO|nr:hypothetical protein POTOM_005575 [Populus tomentosa]